MELARDRAEQSKKSEAEAVASEKAAVAAEAKAITDESDAKNAEGLAKASEEEARNAEFAAKKCEETAKSAESLAVAADNENKRALAELQKEEAAYNGKITELQEISTNPSNGIVKKNKAAAEVAQLKAEDPLPLRRAKINQGATVRKSDIAAKNAVDARYIYISITINNTHIIFLLSLILAHVLFSLSHELD